MPYPNSPFAADYDDDFIVGDQFTICNKDEFLIDIKRWLCKTPHFTSIRTNPLLDNTQTLIDEIRMSFRKSMSAPEVRPHNYLKDVIVLERLDEVCLDLEQVEKEVIVDHICGAAVLRGAHIFAPGVVGMTKDCRIGDRVSVFADANHENRLKKGFAKMWKPTSGKVFIGNGVVRISRDGLFASGLLHPQGVAIQMTDTISGCPPLDQEILHRHCAILQNIPSIVCVEVLDPQENDCILDMCASPGGKTSHIVAKLNHTGVVIALDRSDSKVARLRERCASLRCNNNLFCFRADSTDIVCSNDRFAAISEGPPFAVESFDRILIDAPCSASGKRPQLLNNDSKAVMQSYVPLQRKLFENAYKLLKVNGIVVYSTCSIAIAENEGIVAWALRHFGVELVAAEPRLGSVGFPVPHIPHPEYLQRFGVYDDTDSIGFFIAKFNKIY